MGPSWLSPMKQPRGLRRTLAEDDGGEWTRLRLALWVLLALALLAGVLVLWGNHGRRGRRRRQGGGGDGDSSQRTAAAVDAPAPGPDDRMARRLMDALAVLAVASGLLGAFAPERDLSLPHTPGYPPRHSLRPVCTVPEGPAVALVSLAVAGLAAEAYFIWGLLLQRRRLRDGEGNAAAVAVVPRWWWWMVHAYIWIAYLAPTVAQHGPTQVFFRREGFMGVFMGVDVGSPRFVASVLVAGFSLLVPSLLRGALVFRTGLDYLVEPDAIVYDPARARAWRRHALQSCLYLASSLAAFVYLWLALTLYPTNFLIVAVVTPFLLFLLLAVHLCFVSALPAWFRRRDAARAARAQAAVRRGDVALREGEERKESGDGYHADADGGDADVDTPAALRRMAGGSDGGAVAGGGGRVEKDGGGDGKGKKGPGK